MQVTYLGTTVLLFDDGIDQILFDAHITRPSIPTFLFGKMQTDEKAAEQIFQVHGMDRLRAIFISHSHHDHVLDMPFFANRTGADVYGSESTLNVARGGHVQEEKLHLFAAGKLVSIGEYRITVLPSRHSKPGCYNNDLGQEIIEPVVQPAGRKAFKEGGSYDFLVQHGKRTYLIRPSYNYIEGQLDGIKADVLFLGVAGITKSTEEERESFCRETLDKVQPKLVIPIHWDNFFTPLSKRQYAMPVFMESTREVHRLARQCCEERNIQYKIMLPQTKLGHV
ncbi:MAG: MBL fold metallo-hydrolase [Eubacteriales bacterium]|nr:MBL fold metallo-hydrolase [Eubacteriales bacterium]